ncbi:MAG: hypothetical protein Kow0077_01510 [Anaerolineae bacterium]
MNHCHALRSNDFAAVAAWLARVPLMQRYGVSAESAARQLAGAQLRGDSLIGLYEDGENCIGLAWIIPDGAFGRSAYLRLIAVHSEATGRGLGTILLEEAERTAAQSGPYLFLLVSDFNTAAQRFYARHGYQQIGAVPGFVLPDVTELIYWKRLTPSS